MNETQLRKLTQHTNEYSDMTKKQAFRRINTNFSGNMSLSNNKNKSTGTHYSNLTGFDSVKFSRNTPVIFSTSNNATED